MLPSFFNQNITRIRPGHKDSRGSTVPDWSNTDILTITGCSVQPSSSDISIDGRVLGLKDMYRVYCAPGTDVQAGDRITYDGETFEVTEAPRKWQSPTGRVSNVQFSMTRWSG